MKTKTYAKYATSLKHCLYPACIFIGSTVVQEFTDLPVLFDHGDAVIAERTFRRGEHKRIYRLFPMRNGDIGLRSFEHDMDDEGMVAERVFGDEGEALKFLSALAGHYSGPDKRWTEV